MRTVIRQLAHQSVCVADKESPTAWLQCSLARLRLAAPEELGHAVQTPHGLDPLHQFRKDPFRARKTGFEVGTDPFHL